MSAPVDVSRVMLSLYHTYEGAQYGGILVLYKVKPESMGGVL